jgi:hypothetical protein
MAPGCLLPLAGADGEETLAEGAGHQGLT